jgi:uncharacterized protein (DUF1800 family)
LIALTWGWPDLALEEARQIQGWLGIFPVNWRQLPHVLLLRQQIERLQACLSADFPTLLQAMVLNPALQISLNGPANQRLRPNENLARELLELFSLGEGNYSESDVREAARALSGYRLTAEQALVLDPRRHDDGIKTILGRSATFDALTLTSWLAQQPQTAQHIITRLWRGHIGAIPPPQRIHELAQAWTQQNLSLPWLMHTLSALPEALTSRSQGLRLADPLELMARSLRLLGSQHPEALAISLRGLSAMGQAPFEPPSVKGWPVNEGWLNLRWLNVRRRTLQQLLANDEVWDSRQLPPELSADLTSVPPLTLFLPAPATRETLAMLFADPVWQLG